MKSLTQVLKHVIDIFARPLGMTTAELRQRMKLDRKGQDYVVIKPDLSEDDAEKLKQLARDIQSLHPSCLKSGKSAGMRCLTWLRL